MSKNPSSRQTFHPPLPLRRGGLPLMACWLAGALHGADAGPEPDQPKTDKTRYHLLNPTPHELMREMRTDRPDKTESAYTVDAGHFQFEIDLATYTRDRDGSAGGDTRTDTFAITPLNLKLGLLNNMDFQVMLDPYKQVRVIDGGAGTTTKRSGFGDVTTRLKVNLWGNDGGRTALAVMPFVKFPSNQDGLGNNSVEAGIIFPLAVELPFGWSMGIMAEFDFPRNETGGDYHTSFVNSITLGRGICGNLGGYVEFFSEISTQRGSSWVGTVDLGLAYKLADHIQLDAGLNIGVTSSADDFNPFVGVSWRF